VPFTCHSNPEFQEQPPDFFRVAGYHNKSSSPDYS